MATTPTIPTAKTTPVPLKVQRHRVDVPGGDTSVQRHLDNTSDAVDSTLAFVNSTFMAPPSSGGAAPTSSPAAAAAANNPKVLTTRAGITANGPISGSTVNCGGMNCGALNCAAVTCGPITSSGAVTGTTCSFPGSAFKYTVGPFGFAATSYGGGIAQCAISYGSLTMGSVAMGFPVQFNGSIIAICGRVQSNTATTFQPYLYKNNNSTQLSNGSLTANLYVNWGQTYTKGTMPVVAGDYFGIGVGWGNASISVQATAYIMFEAAP